MLLMILLHFMRKICDNDEDGGDCGLHIFLKHALAARESLVEVGYGFRTPECNDHYITLHVVNIRGPHRP
jgi:hypothetical protein